MYRKSKVPCKRLFSSASNIVNKMRSSLEPNTVNMLHVLRGWLSDDIKRLCYLLFLTEFYVNYHIL